MGIPYKGQGFSPISFSAYWSKLSLEPFSNQQSSIAAINWSEGRVGLGKLYNDITNTFDCHYCHYFIIILHLPSVKTQVLWLCPLLVPHFHPMVSPLFATASFLLRCRDWDQQKAKDKVWDFRWWSGRTLANVVINVAWNVPTDQL